MNSSIRRCLSCSWRGRSFCLSSVLAYSLCGVDSDSSLLLDALDHFCLLVDGDPEVGRVFYAATTPEEMVSLAVEGGILIDAEDFRALLRSGSTEFWLVRGEDETNPIAHLLKVFRI